jgi:hypothetical protein
MQRDIDLISQQLTASIPGIHIAQLDVSHPGADDDGLWFINIQDHAGQVQMESPDGMCPFLIESDFSNERVYGVSVGEVIRTIRRIYGV